MDTRLADDLPRRPLDAAATDDAVVRLSDAEAARLADGLAPFPIWEPRRFRRRTLEATQQALALRNRPGSRETATDAPLPPTPGARE